jgi:hypothetical protein
VFILLELPSPSRRIFIGSHSLPPPSMAIESLTYLFLPKFSSVLVCLWWLHDLYIDMHRIVDWQFIFGDDSLVVLLYRTIQIEEQHFCGWQFHNASTSLSGHNALIVTFSTTMQCNSLKSIYSLSRDYNLRAHFCILHCGHGPKLALVMLLSS